MGRVVIILLVLAIFLFTNENKVLAQSEGETKALVGILHPGFMVCDTNQVCQRSWWLLDEQLEKRVILAGIPISPRFEGYLVWVSGVYDLGFFRVDSYQVLSAVRFGDLLPKVTSYFRSNLYCLLDGDRFRGKLREFWSGEHNEVTLIFRFYSTYESPNAFVELRYNGTTGRFLGQTLKPKSNPCQVRFW